MVIPDAPFWLSDAFSGSGRLVAPPFPVEVRYSALMAMGKVSIDLRNL